MLRDIVLTVWKRMITVDESSIWWLELTAMLERLLSFVLKFATLVGVTTNRL